MQKINSFIKANHRRCIGCRTCQIACVVSHEGMEIFTKSPEEYSFNPKLFVVKTAEITAPVQCHHCEEPPCQTSCLEGAIYREGSRVVVENEKCIGCKSCIVACPFGAIELVGTEEFLPDGAPKKLAHKCDLCAHRNEGPACVEVCPMDALELVTEDSMQKSLADKRLSAVLL